MSTRHTCHTCGSEYNCNEKWCPSCGKRLGHKQDRGLPATAIVEPDFNGTKYRCSECGNVVLDFVHPSFCGTCGSKFINYLPTPEYAERERRKKEAAEQMGVTYVPLYCHEGVRRG